LCGGNFLPCDPCPGQFTITQVSYRPPTHPIPPRQRILFAGNQKPSRFSGSFKMIPSFLVSLFLSLRFSFCRRGVGPPFTYRLLTRAFPPTLPQFRFIPSVPFNRLKFLPPLLFFVSSHSYPPASRKWFQPLNSNGITFAELRAKSPCVSTMPHFPLSTSWIPNLSSPIDSAPVDSVRCVDCFYKVPSTSLTRLFLYAS